MVNNTIISGLSCFMTVRTKNHSSHGLSSKLGDALRFGTATVDQPRTDRLKTGDGAAHRSRTQFEESRD